MTTQSHPLKRAIRNGLLMAVVVGGVTHFQGSEAPEVMTSMLFTFGIVTPALWLSYRFTQKLLQRQRHKPD
ncbi:hypothetical protein GHNINEIG_01028 [Hydrogenovibrio crunogenus]|uniref:Uncharacterized protein n=1 Tax=Hydrogenovibrio crunogenus TaxID=39765 RepID=A0A4P7NZ08_9GAMM|nr:hypothetical protein [Hydrogenovibrio crunogenus]QBZ82987.1 hypothetical protein GHNINEIG_01028 [Hydrogenovibrio crunogenus]